MKRSGAVTVAVCLVALLGAACSSPPEAEGPIGVPGQAPKTVVVIAGGAASGRGLSEPAREAWPQLLLAQHFAPGDLLYTLTVPDGFAATARVEAAENLAGLKPDVVIVLIGGRDDSEDTPVEVYQDELRGLLDLSTSNADEVYLATLLTGHPDDDRDPAYNEAIRTVGQQSGAVVVEVARLSVSRQTGDDSFLPDVRGHRQIADAFGAALG